MKILDKYITKNFLLPLGYCLFLFMMLYVITDVFGHLDEILKNKVPAIILTQYYLSFIPLIFVQSIPIAALLAIVYMLSALNKNNELTAIRSCGISIARLLLPIFLIGIILSLSSFIINERIVPKTTVAVNRIKEEFIDASPSSGGDRKELRNLTIYGKENQMVYAKIFDTEKNILYDIIILENDNENRLKRKIIAKKALWMGANWIFFDCVLYKFTDDGKPQNQAEVYDKRIIKFPYPPNEIKEFNIQTNYMNYKQLTEYIERIPRQDSKTKNSFMTDLHFRTAVPFVTIIIMLLGIPFALATKRGGAITGIGISIGIGLLYYGSIYFTLALGKGGLLPALAAAHIANVVFFITALALLTRRR